MNSVENPLKETVKVCGEIVLLAMLVLALFMDLI